jgi:uncharacterized protein DUF3352
MNVIKRLSTPLLLLLTVLIIPAAAQQKRQTPIKPQPKPAAAAAPTPAPTFDNLLPADSYVVYGEVRDAGQLISSSALNDLLEPVLKLAGPPREFKSVVKWLNAHAEQVTGSRLCFAAWPFNKNVPDVIVVLEFASAEEAAKFATPLNEFLPTVLPPAEPEPSPKTANEAKPPAPPKPNFHIERLGSLVVITPRPWTMKQMRPAGSKSLAEEPNFRTAHNRFNSEPIFAFIDFKLMEKEEEERRKQYEAERLKVEAQAKQAKAEAKQNPEEIQDEPVFERKVISGPVGVLSAGQPEEEPTPDPVSIAFSTLGTSLFGGETNMPEGLGLALSYEGESFDLRALIINAAGERTQPLPFWPHVIMDGAIAFEAANIFPAGTELFATMSLDLPQIYVEMSKPPKAEFMVSRGPFSPVTKAEPESPFKAIETKLQLNIKDDLLPLLGSEIAVALPMEGMNVFGLPGQPPPTPKTEEKTPDKQAPVKYGPILAISVKDQERVRALMPKVIEALGFKGANQFAATERREDTELVSYANLFAYAFVGNFLVLSSDATTVRHVVDSYLKNETLASDIHFKSYTRWQPRQVQGQIYISPSLMEGYRNWATQPTTRMSDQMRNYMMRLSTSPQPITYAVSNEGLGPLHELHLPKNLVAMLVAGISGEMNPPATLQNERMAIGMMYSIAHAEEEYKSRKGGGACGTLEDLIAAGLIPKEVVEKSSYKFEVTPSGEKFEATAVPLEYGKSGTMSLFIDHTQVLRGGDRNGAAATASDPPIY